MDNDGDQSMKANRVSIRAVLVHPGQDPVRALLDSGILDPVTVPFMPDDGTPGGSMGLGDGITPNIRATLDFGDPGAGAAEPDAAGQLQDEQSGADSSTAPHATSTLPAAHGITPLAPVRKRRL